MLKISIDFYAFLGILVIAVVLIIAMILVFIAFIWHDKRRYASIDKFNEISLDKSKFYNENLKGYNKNVGKSGVDYAKKSKLRFLKTIIIFFKRGFK